MKENQSQPNHSKTTRPRTGTRRSSFIPFLVTLCVAAVLGVGAFLFLQSRDSNRAHGNFSPAEPEQPMTFLPEEEDPARAVELLEEGNQLLAREDVNGALAKYREALRLYPGDEDIHYNLAIAYGKLGQTELAIKHNREALSILPDYPEVHNNLGNLLANQENYDEAIRHFQAALELQPDYPLAHNNLGSALARQGRMNEATLRFAEAIRLDPNYVEAQFNLGNAYAFLGRTDEAIDQYHSLLQIRPDFQPARRALARMQQKQQFSR
jgi:tetratricopeptide (TPR) repeat protein